MIEPVETACKYAYLHSLFYGVRIIKVTKLMLMQNCQGMDYV